MTAISTEGRAAPRLSNSLLGTVFFLITETVFFVGLVFVALEIRRTSAAWPPIGSPSLSVPLLVGNTVVLLGASAAMIAAVRSADRSDSRALLRWVLLATGLGIAFTIGQVAQFVGLGGWLPDGGVYRTLYEILAGLHAVHVLAGIGLLAVVAYRTRLGQLPSGQSSLVRASAWYWHFVTGVWLLLLAALISL